VTSADVSVNDRRSEEHAEERRRWDRWQERYPRSSRGTSIQPHIVAAILLGGIALLLVLQFLATVRVSNAAGMAHAGRPIQVDEQFTTTKDTWRLQTERSNA
jgi:hypothetical protein